MKNKSGSRVGRLFKNVFRVRSWVDLDRIRQGTRYIVGVCSTYFVPQSKTASESFTDAMVRLKLTDQDLLIRQKGLLRLVISMLSAAMLLFIYFLYNLYYARFAAVLMSCVVMLLALVLAFRYHFWYFQIKEQKLGCTLKEWFWQGLMGAPKND